MNQGCRNANGGLALTRYPGERIVIGPGIHSQVMGRRTLTGIGLPQITITVAQVGRGGKVSLCINAPADFVIMRPEVLEREAERI